MSKKLSILLITIFLLTLKSYSQDVSFQKIQLEKRESFRGISSPAENVIWISGTHGTIGRSLDGGIHWEWKQVKGFEKTDFRDIHAFDSKEAIIMGIDSPAVILKTFDGGNNWKEVYRNNTSGMFLDAIDFKKNNGIVVGDPINDRFFIATTNNKGNEWYELAFKKRPIANKGEACFAASGSNIILLSKKKFLLVSGGANSSFIKNTNKKSIPFSTGQNTIGTNSITTFVNDNAKYIYVSGGNFAKDGEKDESSYYSTSDGETWNQPTNLPSGYRSAIAYIKNGKLITCGTSGIDVSSDYGQQWKLLNKESYHAIAISPSREKVFLVGGKGNFGIILSSTIH
jgi:photosystem II stability/assembly factor-like uncharacterized protein